MKIPKTSISMMVILGVWALVASMAVPGSVQIVRADGGGIEPPPSGTPEPQQKGPAVSGIISLDGTTATFAGKCKGKEVNVGPFTMIVDLIKVSDEPYVQSPNNSGMTNYPIAAAGPAGCYSTIGQENMIINTVNKITKFGNPTAPSLVVADITLQFLIPR